MPETCVGFISSFIPNLNSEPIILDLAKLQTKRSSGSLRLFKSDEELLGLNCSPKIK